MKSFNEVYEEIMKQHHEDLEILRKKKVKVLIIESIVSILILFLLRGMIKGYGLIYSWFVFGFALCVIGSMIGISRKFGNLFKPRIIEPIIKSIDSSLEYYHNIGISSKLYRKAEFGKFETIFSDDFIRGKLEGKYDIKMGNITTFIGKDDAKQINFTGFFVNIQSKKNISTSVKILKKAKDSKILEMDSSEFEKYFDVIAENKIIAMQILTADVMQKMIDFIKKEKIEYELTIIKNQIYIRFNTGQVFEPKMFKKVIDYNMLKRYYDTMVFVLKVSTEITKVIEESEI